MATGTQNLNAEAQRGIDLCRRGRWKNGLEYLLRVAATKNGNTGMPGLFYSYLGYGIARYQRRKKEGLELCRHAVKVEFYEPDNFLNLARTELLVGNRKAALRSLEQGLALDPAHAGLGDLRSEMGRRRRPPIPFLGRSNPVNVAIGKALAHLRGESAEDDDGEGLAV